MAPRRGNSAIDLMGLHAAEASQAAQAEVISWPLLEGLEDAERDAALAAALQRSWQAEEYLFRAGDYARGAHLLERGRVAICAPGLSGTPLVLRIHRPGEWFGDLALVRKITRRSADAVALEPVRTLVIVDSDLARLKESHPSMRAAFEARLAEDVDLLRGRLVEAHCCSAPERVLRAIARLSAVYEVSSAMTVAIPLGHETIARFAGTSRQVVSQTLGDEVRRGSIELGRELVTVVDLLRFRRIGLTA